MRNEIIKLILKIAKEKDAFDSLEKHLSIVSRQELSKNIIDCGILPETFKTNGSEEKLWAKFSDILLARSLNFLGFQAEVLATRGNSADVLAKSENYTLVGDAKTFRLSRTTVNQKDLKIDALRSWRKENNYALLVMPLMQYPKKNSQIFSQAISNNVTLISYTHLHFLLDFYREESLQNLWETGEKLKALRAKSEHEKAIIYWSEIDNAICQIVKQPIDELKKYKTLEIQKTKEIGNQGIAYLKKLIDEKIAEFDKLTKKEVVKLLINAPQIEAKIKTIEKVINRKVIL